MLVYILVTFVDLFVFVFDILIVLRVFAGYIVAPENRFFLVVVNMTEPLIAPVRQLLPRMGGLDFSPLATFFLLQGIQYLADKLLSVT